MPLICKLSNPEPDLLYLALHPRRHYPSTFIIPGPVTGQLETAPLAQSPLKLFKLVNSKLFTLLCLAFPTETPIKAVALFYHTISNMDIFRTSFEGLYVQRLS